MLAALLVLGGFVSYWGLPWLERGAVFWRAWRNRRQLAYRQSAASAWQQVAAQLRGQPAQVGALYLWTRRSLGADTLVSLVNQLPEPTAQRLLAFLRSCYGPAGNPSEALAALQQALPELKESGAQQQSSVPRHGLLPMNPRQPVAGPTHRDAR